MPQAYETEGVVDSFFSSVKNHFGTEVSYLSACSMQIHVPHSDTLGGIYPHCKVSLHFVSTPGSQP